jgi:hypothetical protein
LGSRGFGLGGGRARPGEGSAAEEYARAGERDFGRVDGPGGGRRGGSGAGAGEFGSGRSGSGRGGASVEGDRDEFDVGVSDDDSITPPGTPGENL